MVAPDAPGSLLKHSQPCRTWCPTPVILAIQKAETGGPKAEGLFHLWSAQGQPGKLCETLPQNKKERETAEEMVQQLRVQGDTHLL